MSDFATVDDVATLWRELTDSETERAEALIPVICASLRVKAAAVGKDLDAMVEANESFALVAKSVVVDVAARTLMTATNQEPMTQMSESAGGYSVSGTFLIPGGGLFIKKSELARLGLCRQRMGVLEPYELDQGH